MPSGNLGIPLYRKLGIKAESRVCAIGAPQSVVDEIQCAEFPVEIELELSGQFDVMLYFIDSFEGLAAAFGHLVESVVDDGGLWICWPKRTSKVPTDVTEDRLRQLFLPNTPMVDNKVCSIDDVWSGLRFVRRKEFR